MIDPKTLDSYEQMAAEYATINAGRPVTFPEFQLFKQAINGNRVLDIGCGGGRDTELLASQGYEVTAIDPSPAMLAEASKLVPNAHFWQMDVRNLLFDSESFDGAWALASLLHMPKNELAKALSEIYRVLVPGGVLLAEVKKGTGEGWRREDRYGRSIERYFALYSKREFDDALEAAGFSVLDHVETTVGSTDWIAFLVRK